MANREIRRPILAAHVRYRWDPLRRQHQIVFPEGLLVLNETGAAIVKRCDGRTLPEILGALGEQFPEGKLDEDVSVFLDRLARKGWLRDAGDS